MRGFRTGLILVILALVLLAPATNSSAAEQGDDEAKRVFKEKIQEAAGFILMRQAAEQGNTTAQYSLGEIYRKGTGVPIDFKQAVYWYRKAAEQNLGIAQFRVGDEFRVNEDFVQAVHWYGLAAEQGNADAQNMLGGMYYSGKQIPANYPKAARLFLAAANQGHPIAQAFLSAIYSQGKGFPQSYVRAYAWASVSVLRGEGKLGPLMKASVVEKMSKEQISDAQKLTAILDNTIRK